MLCWVEGGCERGSVSGREQSRVVHRKALCPGVPKMREEDVVSGMCAKPWMTITGSSLLLTRTLLIPGIPRSVVQGKESPAPFLIISTRPY